MIETKNYDYEKAVLVGVIHPLQKEEKLIEYMDELAFLITTAGAQPTKRFMQKVDKPDAKTYIRKGKLHEIKQYITENNIDLAVFDDELSPAQQNNIEKELNIKVVDRTRLILDIFAQRATSSYAKTQVELAQYEYLLPRLTGMWTHLERQRGGIGMRGPGETEIETDRRIVRDKIALLKKKLEKIDKQMAVQRSNRKLVRAALIGYTNVGKSSIMNLLSKSEVFVENKLFATLDTTVRKVIIENVPFLLSDTVGFIRKLPTQLVESFKSTLMEVQEADILIHVIDVSNESWEEHKNTVDELMEELKVRNKKIFYIYNKIDLLSENQYNQSKNSFIDSYFFHTLTPEKEENIVFTSIAKNWNIGELRDKLLGVIKREHVKRFPYNRLLFLNYDKEGNLKD